MVARLTGPTRVFDRACQSGHRPSIRPTSGPHRPRSRGCLQELHSLHSLHVVEAVIESPEMRNAVLGSATVSLRVLRALRFVSVSSLISPEPARRESRCDRSAVRVRTAAASPNGNTRRRHSRPRHASRESRNHRRWVRPWWSSPDRSRQAIARDTSRGTTRRCCRACRTDPRHWQDSVPTGVARPSPAPNRAPLGGGSVMLACARPRLSPNDDAVVVPARQAYSHCASVGSANTHPAGRPLDFCARSVSRRQNVSASA